MSGVLDMRLGRPSKKNRFCPNLNFLIQFVSGRKKISINFNQNRKKMIWQQAVHVRSLLFLVMLIVSISVTGSPSPVSGNEADFWQFDAQGRIERVLPADVDQDGLDEIFVAATNNQLTLLEGTGEAVWVNTSLDGQVQALHLLSRRQNRPNELLAVGLEDALVLLEAATGRMLWRRNLTSAPKVIRSLDVNQDGREEIVLTNRLGSLQMFASQNGELLWPYAEEGPVGPSPLDASPLIEVADFNGDNQSDIAFAYFSLAEIGYLTMVDRQGELIWRVRVDNQVSTLTVIEDEVFEQPAIAVGTREGQVGVYDGKTGKRLWWRTPNRGVTVIKVDNTGEAPLLLVGTDAGKVIAYDFTGRRLWESILSDTPLQPVRDILVVPPSVDSNNQVVKYGVLISEINSETESESGKMIILNESGRRVLSLPASFLPDVNHIVDLNRDGFPEMAISTLGTLSLKEMGLGTGSSQVYTNQWIERTGFEPAAVLAIQNEYADNIFIGTASGNLLELDIEDGATRSLVTLPYPIDYLAWHKPERDEEPLIFIGSNRIDRLGGNGSLAIERGTVDAVNLAGERIWSVPIEFDQHISLMTPVNLNRDGPEELIIGYEDGQLMAIGSQGNIFWNTGTRLDGRIVQVLPITSDPVRVKLAVITDRQKLYLISNKGQDELDPSGFLEPSHLFFDEPFVGLHQFNDQGSLLLVGASGNVAVVNRRLQIDNILQRNFTRNITFSRIVNGALLIGFDDGQIVKLSLEPEDFLKEMWRIPGPRGYQNILWDDINNDTRPDLIVGDDLGRMVFYTEDGQQFSTVELPSRAIEMLKMDGENGPQLLTVTDNGIVSSFAAQPNRPPLLINSAVEVENGRFTFSLSVTDMDEDPVTVTLLIFDERIEQWVAQGERVATQGDGSLVWILSLGTFLGSPLQYQFLFDDGVYNGTVQPAPVTFETDYTIFARIGLGIGGLVFLAFFLFVLQQTNSPNNWRAWRLYRRVIASPTQTLNLLDAAYARTKGSSDILLNLSNRARRDNQQALTRLLDGLFLLADRTPAGLEIMATALELAEQVDRHWHNSKSWQKVVQTARDLFLAQSITELGLLRPNLVELIKHLQSRALPAVSFEALLGPLASYRDSSRLNLVDDRLAYLHEAVVLLRQEQALLFDRPQTVQNTIASAIVNRWLGMTNALIDDLRGRPWLATTLMTKRIVSAETTQIAVEIENSGPAAAEDLRIFLHESSDYSVVNHEQIVPYLPSRRSRIFNFTITPHVLREMRLSLTVSYLDANRQPHSFDFADMVRLLSSERPFKPIPNPYAPGTPLRRESPLFFGREALLNFIVRTASRPTQPNVVILVGQRRTGKTSALLRIGRVAPADLIPVFVDCQSLGIVPGMAAFLHDLSWFIADALEHQGIEIEVPELDGWADNPVYYFQRRFLPYVLSLLPESARLLLIFDEFEAFEGLVNDQLLPPTLFPFLRHLMQHGDRLNFLFAGTHRLEQMSSEYWSILFNIALYRQIGFLDRHAAYELITQPVDPLLIYDDLALEKIWRVTAGHPYFLQLMCYTLVSHANQFKKVYVTVSDVNVTMKEMLRLGEVHFAYLWQQSSFEEKALLIAASHLHDLTGPLYPVELSGSLEGYDLFLTPKQVTDALDCLVERGILQEIKEEGIKLYEFRVGLVGQWVVENKSLTELHEIKYQKAT